jgi:hypothetical protein
LPLLDGFLVLPVSQNLMLGDCLGILGEFCTDAFILVATIEAKRQGSFVAEKVSQKPKRMTRMACS